MDTKKISMFSGAALLAFTAPALAGPMSVASENAITPPLQTEQVHYYRHHYRHYGWYRPHHRYRHYGWYRHHRYWHHAWFHHRHRYVWRRGWHYGWYRARYPRYAYRYRYPSYGYGYAPGYWNPLGAAVNTAGAITTGALGLAAAPFAWATGYPSWPYNRWYW